MISFAVPAHSADPLASRFLLDLSRHQQSVADGKLLEDKLPLCSDGTQGPNLTDAVEKVCSVPSARNNRIILADFLNRSCAFDARFESILLAAPPKILFQQHRPVAEVTACSITFFGESFFTIQTNAQAATGTGQEKSSRAPSGLVQEMTMKSQDIDQMKDARAPWIAGNFGAIAKTIGAPDAEGFVARLALEPDVRVLDTACGTGNVTFPLARRGATVTGLDMTPHLLEEARARAASEGLNIRFDDRQPGPRRRKRHARGESEENGPHRSRYFVFIPSCGCSQMEVADYDEGILSNTEPRTNGNFRLSGGRLQSGRRLLARKGTCLDSPGAWARHPSPRLEVGRARTREVPVA